MRTVGALVLKPIGWLAEKSGASAMSNVFTADAVTGAIDSDVADGESSVSGAWANTLVLYLGWSVVMFTILGAVLGGGVLKKMPMRRKRKATRKRATTRRTYKRRKK